MSFRLFRVCLVWLAVLTCVSFLGSGAFAQEQAMSPTATVTGMVQQSDGSPAANATVQLTGATTLTSKSGTSGSFVFLNVPYGNYRVVVNVKGLGEATREHIVVAGDMNVTVRYEATSLNGLKVIASVSAANRAQISTQSVSVTTLNQQTLADQGQNNWAHVLNEIPGVAILSTTSNSATSTYPDSPFASQILSLGGALPYESSLMLDGMPLTTTTQSNETCNQAGGTTGPGASSSYNGSGVNLNAYDLSSFGSVNVSLGSNPDSPSILNSVGGNLNLSPPGAASRDSFRFSTGTDAYGGTISNSQLALRIGTKLSLTMTYDFEASPGPQEAGDFSFCCITPNVANGGGFLGGAANYCNFCGAGAAPQAPSKYEGQIFLYNTTDIQCCLNEGSAWKSHSGSLSAHYQASPNVSVSFFYEGQEPGQAAITPEQLYRFAPGPGYPGSISIGTHIEATSDSRGFTGGTFPGIMNQFSGLYEEKLNATVGRGQLSVAFLQNTTGFNLYQVYDPGYPWPKTYPLSGIFNLNTPAPPLTGGFPIKVNGSLTYYTCVPTFSETSVYYNNKTLMYVPFPFENINQSTSYNRDASLSYTVPLGKNYHAAVSYTQSYDTQYSNYLYRGVGYCPFGFLPTTNGFYVQNDSVGQAGNLAAAQAIVKPSNYNSSHELHFSLGGQVTAKLNVTLSDYLASTDFHALQSISSGPVTNQTSTSKYANADFYDQTPRVGAVYRLNANVAIRASAGGSYTAPPASNYVGNIGSITPNGCLLCSPSIPTTAYTLEGQNPNLKPETGFQFTLGTDIRLGTDTVFSFDAYRTNLNGQFYANSTRLPITILGLPLYSSYTANLGQSRYEGVNASLRHEVARGWYSQVQFGFTRGYIVSVPRGFYNTDNTPGGSRCTFTLANLNVNNYDTGLTNCQNLGIIPGINFDGQPYSQGFGTIGYRWSPLKWIAADATYYGPNNQYYRPAFMVFNLNAEYPLNRFLGLHVTVDNLSGIYDSPAWITDPNQNPVIGAPQAVGPAQWQQGLEYGPRTFLMRLDLHV